MDHRGRHPLTLGYPAYRPKNRHPLRSLQENNLQYQLTVELKIKNREMADTLNILLTDSRLHSALTPIFSESGFQVFPDKSNPMLRLEVLREKLPEGANAEAYDKEAARVATESFMVVFGKRYKSWRCRKCQQVEEQATLKDERDEIFVWCQFVLVVR